MPSFWFLLHYLLWIASNAGVATQHGSAVFASIEITRVDIMHSTRRAFDLGVVGVTTP